MTREEVGQRETAYHDLVMGRVSAARQPRERACLHLGEAAIHKQFCSRDVAAVVGGEKHNAPPNRTSPIRRR
jgi:hypothetical protein